MTDRARCSNLLVTTPQAMPLPSRRSRSSSISGKRRVSTHRFSRVDGEELLAHRGEAGILGADAEGGPDHAARPLGDVRPDDLERHRREAARLAHRVHRARHVGRGVGQGAVEVEEDGADRSFMAFGRPFLDPGSSRRAARK